MTGICNVCKTVVLNEFIIYFKKGFAVQHYHMDCFEKLQNMSKTEYEKLFGKGTWKEKK